MDKKAIAWKYVIGLIIGLILLVILIMMSSDIGSKTKDFIDKFVNFF